MRSHARRTHGVCGNNVHSSDKCFKQVVRNECSPWCHWRDCTNAKSRLSANAAVYRTECTSTVP
eukprot:6199161-Pleurochrysis_carterae.AAC.1